MCCTVERMTETNVKQNTIRRSLRCVTGNEFPSKVMAVKQLFSFGTAHLTCTRARVTALCVFVF